MASTSKQVNYTEEQASSMNEKYLASPTKETVDALALAMGKTSRSVIAKLSRSGIYKAKDTTPEAGGAPVKKDDLANQLGLLIGATEAEINSMTKLTKTVLNKLLDTVKEVKATG